MTDVAHEQDLDLEPGRSAAEEASGSGSSVLDRVKQRRAERLADEPTLFNIAGWEGELKAGYRVVDRNELDRMIRGLRKRHGSNGNVQAQLTQADINFLATACNSVVAYDTETDEREEISDGFNQVLAEKLGRPDLDSARKLISHLFADADGNVNTIAVAAHAMRVARWMQDTTADEGDGPDPLS